ncbi:MAG TPA: CAP domain-containing protein, partial [Bacteroidia bacterium]|nr:CAP domain-containing protein [Bacteroidia bacterium]
MPTLVVGQSMHPAEIIVPAQVDLLYINHLVKTGIDSVRVAHGLPKLLNDTVLFHAAKDHADYLIKQTFISHYQENNRIKYAPHDRVRFYKGDDFVGSGENVLSTYAHKRIKRKYEKAPSVNTTYGQLASDMVNAWVHSPPHFANILNADFEFTAVAVSFNPQDSAFKAVQVFGIRPFYKTADAHSTIFPYATSDPPMVTNGFDQVSRISHSYLHACKLKAPADSAKTCTDCWKESFSPGTTRMEVKNGTAIFYTEDTEFMKHILNNRRDGLALEIVDYKPYDCGNP